MKVYDCFPFFNEFDLLELRLESLWDIVDFFVIAEAATTHQNIPKPFNIELNFDRFKKYWSKIRYIMVIDMPKHPDTSLNEEYQRWSLRRGLNDLQPDDFVIVSNCDEIPHPSAIEKIKHDAKNHDRYRLCYPLFFFKLNYIKIDPDLHEDQGNIIVTKGQVFTDPNTERKLLNYWPNCKLVFNGD
jgi:beta-1,4-mannosyl-glycoprotein beta-1,4-N-acetylglucosaminyltransferase